jgi:phenylalanyl-tRNA synthetase alpha chain
MLLTTLTRSTWRTLNSGKKLLESRSSLASVFVRHRSTDLKRASPQDVEYIRQRRSDPANKCHNLPPHIEQYVGVNLHKRTHHPLNTIKGIIENYFATDYLPRNFSKADSTRQMKVFDDLSPVVTTQQNFDALLIPRDHVSRSLNDTYYIDSEHVLRTHTSAHQEELMKRDYRAFLATGDVYRRDEIDVTHFPVFHQMEGVRVFDAQELALLSRDLNADHVQAVGADLKTALSGLARRLFGDHVEMRWVDAYFPFTEPSWELEVLMEGKWLEVLGCGVIQRAIIDNCFANTDASSRPSSQVHGWAFGLGLERLAMRLFDIPDIRLFWSQDPRFIEQFRAGSINKFKPFSKHPACFKDISFWLNTPDFHSNNFFELVREIAGDLAEDVQLVDQFTHPKTQRRSLCYRINYRSMDRTLTNEEIDALQGRLRERLPAVFSVELR